MTAIKSLRRELNRHRAYIRGVALNIEKGVNEKQTPQALSRRFIDFVSIRNAIKRINNARPVYKWDYPVINCNPLS